MDHFNTRNCEDFYVSSEKNSSSTVTNHHNVAVIERKVLEKLSDTSVQNFEKNVVDWRNMVPKSKILRCRGYRKRKQTVCQAATPVDVNASTCLQYLPMDVNNDGEIVQELSHARTPVVRRQCLIF